MHAYCTRSSSGMIDGPAPLALCLKSPPMPQSPTTPRNEGDCGLTVAGYALGLGPNFTASAACRLRRYFMPGPLLLGHAGDYTSILR
jgi:hypothetical protein